MTRWDAIVIGGGLAGSAAAIQLARAGRKVILMEKEMHAHHKVCGEFLSYEAQHYLDVLGIDYAALGAVPINEFQLIYASDSVTTALPFQGISLSRLVLDEALLQKAADSGVTVMRGVTVSEATPTETGWLVRANDTSYASDVVLLATGKRDLRSSPRGKGAQNNYIGFKMHWKLSPQSTQFLQNKVSIVWFNGGYAGLELVENETANLCLVVTKERFATLGKQWELLLAAIRHEAPLFDIYLTGAVACWKQPLAVFGLPYGYVHKQHANQKNGFYRLGDQLAVIPSFSGDGMAIALHTASQAANAIIEGRVNYHAKMRQELFGQVKLAALLSWFIACPWRQQIAFALCQRFSGLLWAVADKTRLANFCATELPHSHPQTNIEQYAEHIIK